MVAPIEEEPSSEKKAEFFSISNEKSEGSVSSPLSMMSFISYRLQISVSNSDLEQH